MATVWALQYDHFQDTATGVTFYTRVTENEEGHKVYMGCAEIEDEDLLDHYRAHPQFRVEEAAAPESAEEEEDDEEAPVDLSGYTVDELRAAAADRGISEEDLEPGSGSGGNVVKQDWIDALSAEE